MKHNKNEVRMEWIVEVRFSDEEMKMIDEILETQEELTLDESLSLPDYIKRAAMKNIGRLDLS